LAFLTRNKGKLGKILIITLVFEENANFSPKIAENCEPNIDPRLQMRIESKASFCRFSHNHFIFPKNDSAADETDLLGLGVLGGPLQLLVAVHVVLLRELQVPQELGVHLERQKNIIIFFLFGGDLKKVWFVGKLSTHKF
jgi:hypothetical protein